VTEPYELVVAGPAALAIAEQLPEAVGAAVIEFITGVLVEDPHRVGGELRNELAGIFSARRGTYRVLYRIDDERREVIVLRVDQRRDVYRPHGEGRRVRAPFDDAPRDGGEVISGRG
jgi:mRNA interferase RelE/StbE